MGSTAEMKEKAKRILKGKWTQVVLMNLIPMLIAGLFLLLLLFPVIIGAIVIYSNSGNLNDVFDNVSVTIDSGGANWTDQFGGFFALFIQYGLSWTYLDLVRGKISNVNPIEANLRVFKSGKGWLTFGVAFFVTLFIGFWSILLIIPGIIKTYSYAQAGYLLNDEYDSDMSLFDYITKSRELMDGHKMDLFILELSFIGWHLLGALSFGIGYLWIRPYIETTRAVFYDEIKG